MNSIYKDINAMNLIILTAEHSILAQTGRRVKLIVSEEITEGWEGEPMEALTIIANSIGMVYSDYSKPTKENRYVMLRVLGAYFIRTYYPNISLANIGKLLGYKDHTTVIHSLNSATRWLNNMDKDFMPLYNISLNAITQWLAPLS